MSQQNAEPQEVGVAHDVVEQSRHAPEERQRELGHVVEVSCDAPPAGNQQKRLARLSGIELVLGVDHFRFTSPDGAVAFRGAHLETKGDIYN